MAAEKSPADEAVRTRHLLQPEQAEAGDYYGILRLLVGIALEGGSSLVRRAGQWEEGHPVTVHAVDVGPGETPGDRARFALVGLLFEAASTARSAVEEAARRSNSAAGTVRSVLKPVASLPMVRPVHGWLKAGLEQQQARLERWVQIGRFEEPRSRSLSSNLISTVSGEFVKRFGDDPAVGALVDAQVEKLLPKLAEDPRIEAFVQTQTGKFLTYHSEHPEEFDALVRAVGDRYIEYLRQHPEEIRALLEGQTVDLASDVQDEVREITVTADSYLELAVRALLRRPPREALPEPAEEVQARAALGRRPSDYRHLLRK